VRPIIVCLLMPCEYFAGLNQSTDPATSSKIYLAPTRRFGPSTEYPGRRHQGLIHRLQRHEADVPLPADSVDELQNRAS
jgi:hypothetical protein